jgi:hypothetical protein
MFQAGFRSGWTKTKATTEGIHKIAEQSYQEQRDDHTRRCHQKNEPRADSEPASPSAPTQSGDHVLERSFTYNDCGRSVLHGLATCAQIAQSATPEP